MRTLAMLIVLALTVAASSFSQDLVLINANIIDPASESILEGQQVLIRDGKIAAIEANLSGSPNAPRLDLDGKFLLPGLIDGHVHIGSKAQAQKALNSGITTARSMGVSHYVDVGLRELGRDGLMELPEILAAGYHVRPQPSEGLFLDDPSLSDLLSGVKGGEPYARVTAANLERGVDWIKITSTERAGLPNTDPRKQIMTEDEIRSVVEAAKARGVPVACHAHGDEGGQAAVRAGVRTIEHGTYLSEETLRLMKENGTYLVPTVAIVTDLMQPGGDYDDPVLQVRGRHMFPRLREVVMTAHRLGVGIVAATDTGFRANSTMTLQHEIEALTECGLSTMEALAAATSVAAEMMELHDRTGRIAVGFEADLIAIDRSPLDDIRSIQDVLLVVNNGRVVLDRLSFAMQ